MTDNSFGYIEIKDDKVKVYYGDSSNPSIMSFDNPEIVNAMKIVKRLEEFLIKKYAEYVNNTSHTKEWKLLEEISEILKGEKI